jgi:hypothetical protein
MTPSDHHPQTATITDRWREFWFCPQPAYALGLVRIAFGALVIVWASVTLPDLYDLFGEEGVVPPQRPSFYAWSLFQIWTSDHALLIGWVALVVAAIAMTVGWHSRFAAVLVFVLFLSFGRRDPVVFNAGDGVMSLLSLFLALSSCGAALSLDQRRRVGSFWTAQNRAPWPIRLIQVQMSVIYLTAVQAKLAGKSWIDGTAVSYALRADSSWAVLPAPQWLWNSPYIVNLATWGTILVELSIAVLVWNRRCRPWVLAAGVVLHLMIMLTISIGFFSLAMFVMYLAFVPWETVQRMPNIATNIWSRVRRRGDSPQRRPPATGPASSPLEERDVAEISDADERTGETSVP